MSNGGAIMQRIAAMIMFGFVANASVTLPLSKDIVALVIPHPGHGTPNNNFVGQSRNFMS